ncbi:MAG: helix-turn-helix domain-containing protein [Burkholderiaceae bacterium]
MNDVKIRGNTGYIRNDRNDAIMPNFNFSTSTVKSPQKLDAWRDMLSQTFGPLEVSSNSDENFSGAFNANKRVQLQFNELRYSGQKLERTTENIARFDQEYFSLGIPVSGSIFVKQGNREFTIKPGSLFLLNQCLPYKAETTEDEYHVVNVSIPSSFLLQRAPAIKSLYELPINDSSPRGKLLSTFKKYFEDGIAQWSESEAMLLREHFLDLIVMLMVNDNNSHTSSLETSVKMAHRERVNAYIKHNHSDPRLSPKTIAIACGVSVSYLHKLFHSFNLQIEDCIYAQRIETCKNLLLDPAQHGKTLQQIAYLAGFNHSSHCSRLFKEKFGMSPTDYKKSYFAFGKFEPH